MVLVEIIFKLAVQRKRLMYVIYHSPRLKAFRQKKMLFWTKDGHKFLKHHEIRWLMYICARTRNVLCFRKNTIQFKYLITTNEIIHPEDIFFKFLKHTVYAFITYHPSFITKEKKKNTLIFYPLNLLEHSQEVPSKDVGQLILSPVPVQEFLD